jgi:hypothetical protein
MSNVIHIDQEYQRLLKVLNLSIETLTSNIGIRSLQFINHVITDPEKRARAFNIVKNGQDILEEMRNLRGLIKLNLEMEEFEIKDYNHIQSEYKRIGWRVSNYYHRI